MNSQAKKRIEMVKRQVKGRGVSHPLVLRAMGEVPRELFVPASEAAAAYADRPLPIGHGQTISQPFIVGLMCAALELQGGERVLEVGAGSGYAAAVLSRIVARVYAIERIAPLAAMARSNLARAGYDNVEVSCGDGTLGWPSEAPFDAILVSAGAPCVPEDLKRQLALSGRLVVPVGDSPTEQQLLRVTRTSESTFTTQDLGPVRFVPLIGAQGWEGD